MTINEEKCRRCKKCEVVCPTQSLDINAKTTVEDCIACYHCLSVCQADAITNSSNITGPCYQINISPREFELLMQQRRSYRLFKSTPVDPDILTEFITRMRYSPTASNSQTLEFTVIQDQELLQKVNDITIQTLTKAFNKGLNQWTKPLIKLLKGEAFLNSMQRSKQKFLKKAQITPDMITYQAPAMILIHTPSTPTGMPVHDANIWTGMATLYTELLELGTCINGFVVNAVKRNNALKQLMQIPAHHQVHSAILIGYPKIKYSNRVERKLPKITIL